MQRHPADSYEFENGKKVRIVNSSILVRLDPDQDRSATGRILFPEGAMEHIYSTGTVLAFGYIREMPLPNTTKTKSLKEPIPIPDLEPGERCCFIRFRKLQDSNKKVRAMFGDDIIALKPEDILFLFTGNIELGST